MFYDRPPISPPPITPHSLVSSIPTPQDNDHSQTADTFKYAIATPSELETFPNEFSTGVSPQLFTTEHFSEELITQHIVSELPVGNTSNNNVTNIPGISTVDNIKQAPKAESSPPNLGKPEKDNGVTAPVNTTDTITFTETSSSGIETLLLGVIINRREVGSLDVIRRGNTLLVPLENFAQLTGLTITTTDDTTEIKTPLGAVKLASSELEIIQGITHISDSLLQEKLNTTIELRSLEAALIVGLPWLSGSREARNAAIDLEPEVKAPLSGLSSFRQELNVVNDSGGTRFQSYSLLGGRLAGGTWRIRLNNNFENSPNLAEYFFYKRNGRFLYQLGRQQISVHPLLNGQILTGAQFGYTNLPADRYRQSYSANQLIPRSSRSVQTFRGEVPPASFVQLRVGSRIIAQQQVGFDGRYEFFDVNLPAGQNNLIEVLVYDRNNFSVPIEIRSVRLNTSDLLLPPGGNVQLLGLGFSGNLAQNAFSDDYNTSDSGSLVGFYQFRQGLSDNFTVEAGLQAIPNTFQTQLGAIWRIANPVILSGSVGTSFGKLAYNADLDVQLGGLDINANSQLFPEGYRSDNGSRERYNHSLEVGYRFNSNLRLGVLARSRKSDSNSTEYIAPTFYFRPSNSLYFTGRPDTEGQYLFYSAYQPNALTRLSFSSFGDNYATDFSYKLNNNYQLSLGSDFGGNLPARYLATVNYYPRNIRGFSWRLGLAYRDGDVGPIVGASTQLIPGLFARVEYQAIPSRARSNFGGWGDDRLTISLVSDLSFSDGRISPGNFNSFGKDKGAISGRIFVEGSKESFDLGESSVRVTDKYGKIIGGARTNAQGNFFVGNLPEGVYIVEVVPKDLPIELTPLKTTTIAEVAGAAVTKLSFPMRVEYGIAGRITDSAGLPVPGLAVELVNAEGKKVGTGATDEFGLYRVDGLPAGQYTLQVPNQSNINRSNSLPKRAITIENDFAYDQNLQLPISAATKDAQEAPKLPNP
ncbi:Cna B-type [Trichormus variabilis ATCC 29413]|uniref:Cna B-type n=2 Tax=Anabaena variabilis TaxID=264691 RepID=Q3M8B4_TRIV2|nr:MULTISPECIES: carboxypeptidase regulatory-like domain-containing protein [Nostocaceae]ABA22772.1 Cna B-type [Trichormus variabilis ATCC 29413]MBC1216093.1 carboxypeptidase regulatory-like domain-containing protein [Trichormus variabilis ARAD]MBC1255849.1 carboxypeptidase regulatory-like domain-containing protein [Trichormus variabilis V5]MBC1268783.1 carboxypeptidase regulatory-like domain-containing protein [Trichormus variabilis FSR]MBC1304181.1 carboxypeptidase regulatory-like domain-con